MKCNWDIFNVCSWVPFFFFLPLILWEGMPLKSPTAEGRRGSLGVEVFLGFYCASRSRQSAARNRNGRRVVPQLLWMHFLRGGTCWYRQAAQSLSWPSTALLTHPPSWWGCWERLWAALPRGSGRREFWPASWYLVTRDRCPLTSRWPLSPASCLSVRRQSWMPAFVLCVSFHAFLPNAGSSLSWFWVTVASAEAVQGSLAGEQFFLFYRSIFTSRLGCFPPLLSLGAPLVYLRSTQVWDQSFSALVC